MKLVMSFLSAVALAGATGVVRAATVSLEAGDASGEHSFDTAGHWSSGKAPEEGNDYLVALGADAYLRTPSTNITSSASATYTTFAGDRLDLGTADTPGYFYDDCWRYARLRIPALHLVNGAFVVPDNGNYYSEAHELSLYGTVYVDSTTDNPFTFRSVSTFGGLSLRAPLVGDEDAAIRVAGDNSYLALYVDNPDYHGRFIVEGSARLWPGSNRTVTDTTFGAVPATFVKDCIIFKNGGGFASSSSTAWDFKAPNRGIWVIGSGTLGSQGSYTVSMPIGGGQLTGSLLIQPHVFSTITINAPVTCYPVKTQNGTVILGADCTIDDTEALILNGGWLGTAADRTLKVDFKSGGFHIPNSVAQRTALPVLTLAEGSTWTPSAVSLRLSAYNLPLTYSDPERWHTLLKVPLSVKDLSEVTLTLKYSDGNSAVTLKNAELRVETDTDGLQTVSVRPPRYYVVHPDNRPAGHEPVAPYTSWATAATNIEDAIASAVAASGGFVFVDRGFYDIATPIAFAQKRSSVTCPVSLVGVNRETMAEDAEHVILDGGYPARTNRLFTISDSTGCSLRSLTLTHAGHNTTDFTWGGGGVANMQYISRDFVVSGCRLVENWAGAGGCFHMVVETITNCVFIGNTAKSQAACFYNPQGNAGVNENYAKILNCTFISNATNGATTIGTGGRNIRYLNCTFNRNGKKGGSLFGFSYYSVMQNCLFEDNPGTVNFGASEDSPYVWSDITIRNGDVGTGTLLSMPNSAGGVARVTIVSNKCGTALSGGYCDMRSFLVASNVCSTALINFSDGETRRKYVWDAGTLAGNTAANAVRYYANDGNIVNTNVIRNCVFWDNRTTAGAVTPNALYLKKKVIEFRHCDAEHDISAYDDGSCLAVRPRFTPDYRLRGASLLKEQAALSDWMDGATDLDGNPRVLNRRGEATDDALPDIGAFECTQPAPAALIVK